VWNFLLLALNLDSIRCNVLLQLASVASRYIVPAITSYLTELLLFYFQLQLRMKSLKCASLFSFFLNQIHATFSIQSFCFSKFIFVAIVYELWPKRLSAIFGKFSNAAGCLFFRFCSWQLICHKTNGKRIANGKVNGR